MPIVEEMESQQSQSQMTVCTDLAHVVPCPSACGYALWSGNTGGMG